MQLIRLLTIALISCAVAAAAPVLTYSTYLRDAFTPKAIATDPSGNIYLAGSAVIDPASGATGAMVVKLNPQGGKYLYVSILNGQPNQTATAIATDAAGNAYVAGTIAAINGQSYVAKLDPSGDMLFSTTIGGSIASNPQAIAVNASGNIIVTGTAYGAGFPSTPGAYSVADTANQPFILELSPTGSQTIFSATGIGGSAIALDASGNIYVAGTISSLTYPTTPGVYQPAFPVFISCSQPLCMIASQGPNQYVTKIDPTGSKLIYSTALAGTGGATNNGLAVDTAGNAYVTGVAVSGYPFSVPVPSSTSSLLSPNFPGLPFLSKLDPSGEKLLFSVPVGGGGVAVDAADNVYVGGSIGSYAVNDYYVVNASLPALAKVPVQCLPNALTIADSAYVAQVNAASGGLEGTQFLAGSTLAATAITLSGSNVWVAGTTNDANVLYTPNALTPSVRGPNLGAGAYLGAVDFSQPAPPAGTPQIACVLDAANLRPVGPAGLYQLLAIFGTALGPATGVSATDNATTSLGGVSVNFGDSTLPLLYVSSTQINLAVANPLEIQPLNFGVNAQIQPIELVSGGALNAALGVPLIYPNASLFMNDTASLPATSSSSYIAEALNADGSVNSATNPAQPGSTITVFVNGLAQNPNVSNARLQFFAEGVTVIGQQLTGPFVWELTLQLPSTPTANFSCPPTRAPVCEVGFSLAYSFFGNLDLAPVNTGQETMAGVYMNLTATADNVSRHRITR